MATTKLFPVMGARVTKRYLRELYKCDYAFDLLYLDYLSDTPREESKNLLYQICKPLPTFNEYEKLRVEVFTKSLREWLFLIPDMITEVIDSFKVVIASTLPQFRTQPALKSREIAIRQLQELQAQLVDCPECIAHKQLYYLPNLNICKRLEQILEASKLLITLAEVAASEINQTEEVYYFADHTKHLGRKLAKIPIPGQWVDYKSGRTLPISFQVKKSFEYD